MALAISNYDTKSESEILDELQTNEFTVSELENIYVYEKNNQNRQSILEEIDTQLTVTIDVPERGYFGQWFDSGGRYTVRRNVKIQREIDQGDLQLVQYGSGAPSDEPEVLKSPIGHASTHEPNGPDALFDQDLSTGASPSFQSVDMERVDSSDINNVLWASSPDEINDKFSLLPSQGGIVKLVPDSYSDNQWTEGIVFPDESIIDGEITLDLRGSKLTLDTWPEGSSTPLIDIQSGNTAQTRNILGGHIKAGNVPEDDLGIGIRAWDCQRSRFTPRLGGAFDVGIKFRQQNGCGHFKWIQPRVDGADIGVQLGQQGDPCGSDRGFVLGQIGSVGSEGLRVERGGQNFIRIQIENPKTPDSGIRGLSFPDGTGYNNDNTIHLAHGVSGDINAKSIYAPSERQQIYTGNSGNYKPVDRLAVSVPPSNIHSTEWDTCEYSPMQMKPVMLDEIASDDGEVSMNGYGYWKVDAKQTTGGVCALQSPARQIIGTRGAMQYMRATDFPTSNATVRFGPYQDESNYLMFVSDPSTYSNWRIIGMSGGSEIENIDTTIGIDSSPHDFTMCLRRDGNGNLHQHWFLDHTDVAETSVNIMSNIGQFCKQRADITVDGTVSSGKSFHIQRWQSANRLGS